MTVSADLPGLPGEILTDAEQLALPARCQCSYARSRSGDHWRLITRTHCPMHGPALGVSADLPELPGVPASVAPLRCPDCDQRSAEVRHVPAPEPDAYEATLTCRSCGAALSLEVTSYEAGLTAGVLIERARHAQPPTSPDQLRCPECGSIEFELWLGGRQSGNVSCRGCGLLFVPPGRETASTS